MAISMRSKVCNEYLTCPLDQLLSNSVSGGASDLVGALRGHVTARGPGLSILGREGLELRMLRFEKGRKGSR